MIIITFYLIVSTASKKESVTATIDLIDKLNSTPLFTKGRI